MSDRACKGQTKAGKPCKANPLKPGTEIEGVAVKGEHCRTHDPDLPDSARLQRAQPGAGRKPKPKPLEVLREKVESEIERWLAPYEEALQATMGVVVGTGPNASLAVVPDYKTRLAAANAVHDRLYGRPKQTTELTGEGGGPIETRELIPSAQSFHDEVAQIVEEAEKAAASGTAQG